MSTGRTPPPPPPADLIAATLFFATAARLVATAAREAAAPPRISALRDRPGLQHVHSKCVSMIMLRRFGDCDCRSLFEVKGCRPASGSGDPASEGLDQRSPASGAA